MDSRVTLDEWKEECGLVPSTEGKIKCGKEIFNKYWSVPGQELPCPPVWVALIECIGLLLGINEEKHPVWEQTANISSTSRYYPTMKLFRLHCYTVVRQLERVTGIQTTSEVNEAVTLFITPKKNKDDTNVILSLETAAECGPGAVSLCQHLEDVIFKYECARSLIKSARFDFALRNESQYLSTLKGCYKRLSSALASQRGHQLRLIPYATAFEAASHTLGEVCLREVASQVPHDYCLRNMLDQEHHLQPYQLLAVGVLQMAACLPLQLDPPPDEHESIPMLPECKSVRMPTALDREYWESLASMRGQALLLHLPPFNDNKECTWGGLLDLVADKQGNVLESYLHYVPQYDDLRLKQHVLRTASEAWKEEITPYLAVWQQRKWKGLLSIYDADHAYRALVRVLLWVNCAMDEWDTLQKDVKATRAAEQVAAEINVYQEILEKHQATMLEAIRAEAASRTGDGGTAMGLTVKRDKHKRVIVHLHGDNAGIRIAHPKMITKLPPLLHEVASDDEEPAIPLEYTKTRSVTAEHVDRVFRRLDTAGKGYLSRDELEAFYCKNSYDTPELVNTLLVKTLGPQQREWVQVRYTADDLRKVIVALAKR